MQDEHRELPVLPLQSGLAFVSDSYVDAENDPIVRLRLRAGNALSTCIPFSADAEPQAKPAYVGTIG